MWIESSELLKVRRLFDVITLRQGLSVEFDEAEGQRLLKRAPEKVMVVHPVTEPVFTVGAQVVVRSQRGEAWTASVAFMLPQLPGGTTQGGWWYCMESGTRWAFVHESLLDRVAGKNVGEANERN